MINQVFSGMLGVFSHDLAVDMGTANTRVAVQGKGLACSEPSAVAVRYDRSGRRRLVAVGGEAREMLGRTPADMLAIRPLQGGVISDFELAEVLLAHLLRAATGSHPVFSPRVVLCIPYSTTEVERRALRESAEAAGARTVHLLDSAVASAMGADLPITRPVGSMVIDLGAGTTNVAVISLGEVVYSRALPVCGDSLDQAIIDWLRESRGLLVGQPSAEALKIQLGSALPPGKDDEQEIRGRSLETGYPSSTRVRASEVHEAIAPAVQQLFEAVLGALDRTPPELAGDILDRGVVLTGAGAGLRGLERALKRATRLPVVTAESPEAAAVLGASRTLKQPELLRALCA
jgi:rod shape-determining protein MreB